MKRILTPTLVGILWAVSCLALYAQTTPSSGPAAASSVAATADPLAGYAAASPACRSALQKAIALKDSGKWKSAFDAISAYDPKDSDPYAIAMKTRLCLDGFIQSDQFQTFILVDLADGKTLDQARADGSDAPPVPFDPPALTAALVKNGTTIPAVLAKNLGDYYYSGQVEYAGNWIMSDDEAYAKALEQYQAAYTAGVFDADSLQNQAELLMRVNRNAEASPLFQKSLALNPSNATARYNYAVCLIELGDKTSALDQLDKAAELFTVPQPEFDTLSLAARTAADVGDVARSEGYLKKAEVLIPDAPNVGVLRHEIAVQHGNPGAANAAADALMLKYASNPGVVRALISTWFSNGDAGSARAFLERSIAGSTDDRSLGTLQFYFAILLAQGTPSDADRSAALSALDQSVAHMQKVMEPGDDFFTAAQQVRDHLAPAPATTGPAAPPASGTTPAAPPAPKP